MLKPILSGLGVSLLLLGYSAVEQASAQTSMAPQTTTDNAIIADMIFTNGKVYTVNEEQPWAEAFAVKDGKFIAVGNNTEIVSFADEQTKRVDLAGKFTTPGFIDTHFHAVAASILTAELDTADLPTNEEMYARLKEFAAANQGRTNPLITYGWHIQNFGPEGPHKKDLDAIFPDYPVLFVRSDGHGAWANSKALEVAGITKDTEDPSPASYYGRDENGEPTGFIEEIPAYFAVYYPMIGEITEDWLESTITKAFPKFPAVGLTTAFDPGVLFADPIPAMNAVHKFNQKHGAVMRLSMSHYSVNLGDDFADAQALIANSKSDDVFADSIKINVDQSIETGTGYLKIPYLDSSRFAGTTGVTVYSPEKLSELIDRSYANGVNMHFHSCGSAAQALVLDGMEAAIAKHGPGGPRANITHAMMIDTADMPRFDAAQTGASFSALWMMPGESMDLNTLVIGRSRSDDFYPAGRLLAAGGKVGVGSDFPVATTFPSYAPLDSIEMFVRRARAGVEEAAMQGKEQDKLSLKDAIKAATISNAWMMNKDQEFGSIETGKSADFVVLEQNLFDVAEHQISQVKIINTYYRGAQTYPTP